MMRAVLLSLYVLTRTRALPKHILVSKILEEVIATHYSEKSISEVGRSEESPDSGGEFHGRRHSYCQNEYDNDPPIGCCKSRKVKILYDIGFGALGMDSIVVPIEKNKIDTLLKELPPIQMNYRRKQVNFTMQLDYAPQTSMKCKSFINGTLFVLDRATQHNLYHLRKFLTELHLSFIYYKFGQ